MSRSNISSLPSPPPSPLPPPTSSRTSYSSPLSSVVAECAIDSSGIERYGRQMLVPSFGASAQGSLSSLAILVIGAGGLGCPVCLYLASSGIRQLGIADNDTVDISNLHRQIGHTEARQGMNKAQSLATTCAAINSSISYDIIQERIGFSNSLALFQRYDIIVDASDNPQTRYLINDAAVLAGKPVVSGAALGTDGQLSVYGWVTHEDTEDDDDECGSGDGDGDDDVSNTPSKATASAAAAAASEAVEIRGGDYSQKRLLSHRGPCYRCIFPIPPPSSTVRTCADAGVLGPVVGIIGTLQALEVMKIAAVIAKQKAKLEERRMKKKRKNIQQHQHTITSSSLPPPLPPATYAEPLMGDPLSGQLLIFDGASTRFRMMKTRQISRPDCQVCGLLPTIKSMQDCASWCVSYGLASSDAVTITKNATEGDVGGGGSSSSSSSSSNKNDADAAASSYCPCEKIPLAGSAPSKTTTVVSASAAELRTFTPAYDRIMNRRIVLLDVREKLQYAIVHVKGSLNIPLQLLETMQTKQKEREEAEAKEKQQQQQQTSTKIAMMQQSSSGSVETNVPLLHPISTTSTPPTTIVPSSSSPASSSSSLWVSFLQLVYSKVNKSEEDAVATSSSRLSETTSMTTESASTTVVSASSSSSSAYAATSTPLHIYVLCRRGVDSLVATRLLQKWYQDEIQLGNNDSFFTQEIQISNIEGGLEAYKRLVDPVFPLY